MGKTSAGTISCGVAGGLILFILIVIGVVCFLFCGGLIGTGFAIHKLDEAAKEQRALNQVPQDPVDQQK